jgi:hypothetical protein
MSPRYYTLHISAGRRTSPQAMCNSIQERSVVGEIGVDVMVDGIVVPETFEYDSFVGGGPENSPVTICQGRHETLRAAVTLKVGQDMIAFAIVLLEIRERDLDQALEWIANEHIA